MQALHLEVKIGRGPADNGKNQRMGNQDNGTIIPSEKTKRRNVGRLPYKNVQYGQEDMGADGSALSVWENSREYVACHGVGMRWQSECCDFLLEESVQVEKYKMVALLHTRMMKEDPENRTRWKHKWRWYNRGNVSDKMATCWAGEEDWKEAQFAKGKVQVRHSHLEANETSYRTQKQHTKQQQREEEKRHPGIWDPKTSQFTHVVKDLLYNSV